MSTPSWQDRLRSLNLCTYDTVELKQRQLLVAVKAKTTSDWPKPALSGIHRHSDKHATGKIPKAQCAFKILMIHEVLQFALRIAFRCVLHRCGSHDIRCWKLYYIKYILERGEQRIRIYKYKLHLSSTPLSFRFRFHVLCCMAGESMIQ